MSVIYITEVEDGRTLDNSLPFEVRRLRSAPFLCHDSRLNRTPGRLPELDAST